MRQVIYLCDYCQNIISDRTHLSITFSDFSGWVSPENSWRHKNPVRGIKQFCNTKCLGRYFERKDGYCYELINK